MKRSISRVMAAVTARGVALLLASGLAHCGDTGPSGADAAGLEPDAGSDASVSMDASTGADTGPSAVATEAGAIADASMVADAAASDGGAPARFTAAAVTAPPSYIGTTGGSEACTQSFRTAGYAPADASGAKHPLFLYFVGTAGGASDASAKYDCQAGDRVNKAMAERGFVALSVEYDNQLASFFTNKQSCLFDTMKSSSLLAKACAMPSVDCALGIATWGHSQGALLAHAAANFDARVRAVWTTGYSGLTGAKLPFSRFRTVNGEADTANSTVATANKTAGFSATDQCPDDGRDACLRVDGSGWMIVRKAACKLTAADHCWFNKTSCTDSGETLEPNWVDEQSAAPFALEANADWVAQTLARP